MTVLTNQGHNSADAGLYTIGDANFLEVIIFSVF